MDQKDLKNWMVIINPASGKGISPGKWEVIKSKLSDSIVGFNFAFTEYRNHAVQLAKNAISDGYKGIIVIGGDGTLNEAMNGILSQKITPSDKIPLALIPGGTGNDWGRMFGVPANFNKAIKVLQQGKTRYQDVGWVSFWHNGNKVKRYFLNVAGMGFDAQVASKLNEQKEKGKAGLFSYLGKLIGGLFAIKSNLVSVSVDGKKIQDVEALSMCVGIGQYNGNGMRQLPEAIVDDGLLDMTVIKRINKWKIVRNIHRLYNGSIGKLSEVSMYKGKHIRIEDKGQMLLEVDGESVGNGPFEFGILPSALKVVSGF